MTRAWPSPETLQGLQALRAQALALQAQASETLDGKDSDSNKARERDAAALQALRERVADLVLATPPAPTPRPSARFLAACLGLVLLIALSGYAWKGQPESIAPEPPPDRTEAMVEGLARRLQQQPEDAAGWAMLGRSYLVLGRSEPSIAAYRRALALRPRDADLLADLADVLASAQQGSLEGEPATLLQQALSLAPDHLKALALSGTRALRLGDVALAIRHWERLQALASEGHPLQTLAQQGLAEARRRLQPAQAPAAAPSTSPGASAAPSP